MSKSSNVNIMAFFTAMFVTVQCASRFWCKYLHLPVTSWPPNLLCKLHFCTTIDIVSQIVENISLKKCSCPLHTSHNILSTQIKKIKKINGSRIFESIFIKILFDSSGFEETFFAMNLTKVQMVVKGWDCPKFFKTKKNL